MSRRATVAHVSRSLALSQILAMLALLGSCRERGEQGDTVDFVVSDSTVVRLGAVGDEPLYQVRGAFVHHDTLYIAQNSTPVIAMFSTSGRLLGTIGGRGDGPGEFNAISWMQRADSGFFVYDRTSRRLSRFAFNGDYIGSWRTPVLRDYASVQPVGVFQDGSVLSRATARSPTPTRPRTFRGVSQLLRLSPDSADRLLLDSLVESEEYEEPRPRGGGFWTLLPFGRRTDVVVSDNGFAVLSDDSTLQWSSRDGRRTRVDTLTGGPPKRISQSDIEWARSRFAEGAPSTSRLVETFNRMPQPVYLPRHGSLGDRPTSMLRLTGARRVWVLRASPPQRLSQVWEVVSIDGRSRVLVGASSPLELLDEFDGFAVVLAWDRNGVERVEVRRLLRATVR